jgi:prephenate dehydratase
LLRVGHVESLTATAVSIRNLLVGPKGGAALLGPYEAGARKLGLNRSPELVEMGLGNIAIVTGPRLDELLEEWLGGVTADVQVMASAAVADRGLVQVAIDRGLVRSAVVVRDAIWRGRREVIVRCEVRADQRFDTLSQRFQRAVDELFGRPIGGLAARSRGYRSDDPLRLGFLGPIGTFSEIAARHVEALIAPQAVAADPLPSFGDLLSALDEGALDAVVLPIFSSSSGLVRDSALALGSTTAVVRGIGVVDVTVSFDAYVTNPDRRLDGGRVASQCSNFIERHGLVPVAADSTVAALAKVTAGDADVALAPAGLGANLGLAAVALDVGDVGDATTRFLVLVAAGSQLLPDEVAPKSASGAGDRSAWLLIDPASTPALTDGIRRDEVFQSELGHRLWLSSDARTFDPGAGIVALGAFPWPVTPSGPA